MALPSEFVPEPDDEKLLTGEDRTALPHNLEAEQFLLGAIFMDNELMERVAGFLRAEHFYHPAHQQIFALSKRRIDAGFLADPSCSRGCSKRTAR